MACEVVRRFTDGLEGFRGASSALQTGNARGAQVAPAFLPVIGDLAAQVGEPGDDPMHEAQVLVTELVRTVHAHLQEPWPRAMMLTRGG